MHRLAILDDYQGVALALADWGRLPSDVEIEVFREHLGEPAAVAKALAGFDIVVSMRERTPFGEELFAALPDLALLVTTGMRNRSIDLAAAERHGVVVCGTGGTGSATVDLVWGLIIAVLRNIPREDATVRAGGWQVGVGRELEGRTLGVVGLGNIGTRMVEIGRAFRMDPIAWSPNLTAERAAAAGVPRVERDELLARADVVTIHLVLGERTRGLIGARELALMKPDAYLVNTSRGPIVDEAALIDVLGRGAIAGAALDVFDREPLPLDHPLRRLPNTVLTPHIGYVAQDAYAVFFEQALEDVEAFLRGSPVRLLEPAGAL